MTERIWLESYPEGVPADINPEQYETLVSLIKESFRHYSERDAYSYCDRNFTYGEIDRMSDALARYLQSQGLKAGDRVAIMLPNMPQYPISVMAALRAGLTVVNVNPMYTARELSHQLQDAEVSALIVSTEGLSILQSCELAHPSRAVIVCTSDDGMDLDKQHAKGWAPGDGFADAAVSLSFDAALAAGAELDLVEPRVRASDVAVLQYTGGTTGVSKGAMLTHRNLVANLLQFEAWNEPAMRTIPEEQQPVTVCALPMYHIFAFTVVMMLALRTGGKTVIIPDARDLSRMLDLLSRQTFHDFPGVNTLFNGLLHHPDFDKVDWSGLRVCVGGGAPIQRSVAEHWLKRTGCPIREGYGLTEASPAVAANPAVRVKFNGTIGVPLPNTILKVVNDGGQVLPIGESGELLIKGPQVMAGYWRRPDDTAKALSSDGFLKTGDVAMMDQQGYFRIIDRIKDVILVSGFNVFPNEVEEVAASMPGVLECAAVGVSSEKSGEVVKLFVVKKDEDLTVEQVAEFCRERLAGYKRPQHIEFLASLPKTAVGKILRRSLRTT